MTEKLKLTFQRSCPFPCEDKKCNDPNLINASVLIPLVNRNNEWRTIITKRSERVPHPGIWVFPGGKEEEGTDLDTGFTAVRETEEEIGIPIYNIDIIGYLTPQIVLNKYAVTPVVGVIDQETQFKINTEEVSDIAEIPLSYLLQDTAQTGLVNSFQYNNISISGLHYRIIKELKQKLFFNKPNDFGIIDI